ncbi:MAG: hypothetical protein WC791_04750 [Candidatus Paceibacterota bacterium]|jgi:hypothetical protein
MKKYLFLLAATISFYFAWLVGELSLPQDTQLVKYVLGLLGALLFGNLLAEMRGPKNVAPRLSLVTTYSAVYVWNYAKPVAVLTPLGGGKNSTIEYPSHTPPEDFKVVTTPFSNQILWVPVANGVRCS